jgi:phenylpyruvate tautomerase PptA (4-oxalocrotonate tautomerase family)
MTITNPSMVTGTSEDTAIATVTITDGVATITGVAAGTTTVTIKDNANDNMYIIGVTVA